MILFFFNYVCLLISFCFLIYFQEYLQNTNQILKTIKFYFSILVKI